MSLIEQAAKRLEQLRQAGIELPEGSVESLAVPRATKPTSLPRSRPTKTWSASRLRSRRSHQRALKPL